MAASKIYEIFIKNFRDSSGNTVTEETPLYTIPFSESGDGQNVHFINPVVKTEMGKTGTFEFSLYPNNPYYSAFNHLKTIMRVTFDGETLFRGRVLTVDTQPFTGEEKVHCEGDLAFLMDSFQEGVKEEDREETTMLKYIQGIIDEHNRQMRYDGDPDKIIYLGEVPGQYSNAIYDEQKVVIPDEPFKYGESSFQSTTQRFDSLLKQYGGYLRTRYAEEDYVDTIGRYGEGNIDLNNRIVIYNDDGTISTEKSFSVEIDETEVLLPTIVNGEVISEEAAIRHYTDTGEYLGIFETAAEAEDYAQRLHERQEWYYGGRQGKVMRIYLDWLDYCFRYEVNNQPIALGSNLIELNGSTEVNNIFTAVVPIGKKNGKDLFIDGYRTDIHGTDNKRILVPQIVSLFSDAELNKGYHSKADYENAVTQYGIIYKTQNFQNADTQEKLWDYCTDWIRENYAGGINTLTVKAVDLFHSPGYFQSGSPQKILTGDRITITYPNSVSLSGGTITKTLTVLSITHNLYNPEKNDYRIGIPNSQLNRTYGVSSKGGGGGGSKKVGDDESEAEREQREREARWSEYRTKAWNYIIDAQYNNDLYKDLMEKHSDKEVELALKASHLAITEGIAAAAGDYNKERFNKMYHTIVVDGTFHRLEFKDSVHVDPLDSWTDEDIEKANELVKSVTIDGISKEIGLKSTIGLITSQDPSKWGSAPTTKMKLVLEGKKDPSSQETIEEGQLNIWSEAKKLIPDAEKTIGLSGEGGLMGAIQSKLGLDGSGDSATINLDGLTSILNMNDPASVVTDPSNPLKTIELDGGKGTGNLAPKSDGTWKVKLNNTVTYVDEDGHTQTLDGFVSAEDFSIPSVKSFKTKLIVVDNLIAGFVTVGELDAVIARIENIEADYITTTDLDAVSARISTIESDYITSSNIATTIGRISTLSVNNLNATSIGSTGAVSCASLFVGGTGYSYTPVTYVEAVGVTMPSLTIGSSYNFMYKSGEDTGTATGMLVTAYTAGSVNPTTKTVYVLGGTPSG